MAAGAKLSVSMAAAGLLLWPLAAGAEPGLAAEVYAPGIHRGVTEVEIRSGALNGGGGNAQTKVEFAHAFTDWWRPAFVSEWERAAGSSDLTALALENVIDFTATRDWPVHLGAYAEYEVNTQDRPNKFELKLLAQRVSGPLSLTMNIIGERELASHVDWEFGYAAEAAFAFNPDFALGVQGFGDFGTGNEFSDFGEYPHYWGPFAQFELADVGQGEVELQLGYLVGVGDPGADGQFRMKLEWELGEHY